MSRVGRLAGALLAETEGAYFLVGNLKRPCDFAAAGFEPPAVAVDALVRPYVSLQRSGPLQAPGTWLTLALEGEALPRLLAERLLIERTGSVSDRLWRLIVGQGPDDDGEPPAHHPTPADRRGDPAHHPTPADRRGDPGVVDAGWLATVPAPIWSIVRDTVLRCT